MKKILKSLVVVTLSVMFMLPLLSGTTEANAALSEYGLTTGDCYSSTVLYNKNNGYAYYGSVGITATSGLTYRTIGCTVTCLTTGESRSFRLGDANRIFKKDSEVSGSTTYTAMLINFNSAFDYFPKAKAVYSSNKKLLFKCDSIMTIALNDSNYGAINSDGSNYSKYWVYRDAVGAQNSLSEWNRDARVPSRDVANDTDSYYSCWGSIDTFNTYFNKRFTVWNGHPEDTIPVNRGLTNLMGTAKADVKAGTTLGGSSYSNLYYNSTTGYTTSWVKSNTPIYMNWTGYQQYPYDDNGNLIDGLDANDIVRNIAVSARDISTGVDQTSTNIYTAMHFNVSNEDVPEEGLDYDNNGIKLDSFTEQASTTTWYRGIMDYVYEPAPTIEFGKTDKKYKFIMSTNSKNGKSAGYNWDSPEAIILVDDYGPNWTDPVINSDGYTGSNVFTFSNIVDYTGPSKMTGSGFDKFTYCAYGEGKEPSKKTELDADGSNVTIDFNSDNYKGCRNVILELNAYDHLGNKTSKTYSLPISGAYPETTVDLTNYKYKDPKSGDRWFSDVSTANISVTTKVQDSVIQFPNVNRLNLVDQTSADKVYKMELKETGNVLKLENLFKLNTGKSATATVNSERSLVSSVGVTGDASLNNHKFKLTGNGSIDCDGTIYDSDQVEEKDGEFMCIDSQSPSATLEVAGINKASFTATDYESGLSSVSFIDANSGQPIKTYLLSTESKVNFVTAGTYVFDVSDYKGSDIRVTAIDNVGTVYTKVYEKFSTTEYEGDINHNTVSQDGKTFMEVKANGSGVHAPYDNEDYFIFYLKGNGYKIVDQKNDVLDKQTSYSMNYTTRIPDDVNTTESPSLGYTSSSEKATLSWNKLEDVSKNYKIALTADLGPLDHRVPIDSDEFEFSTGYKNYGFKLWSLSDDEFTSYASTPSASITAPSRECNASGDLDALNLDMSRFITGKYLAEVIMYDGNGNPSGKGYLAIDHVQPTLQLPLALNVTAVKDVNWENIRRPLEYSKFADANLIEQPIITQGADYSLFSLGSITNEARGIKAPVSLGYTVNYRLRRSMTNVSKVGITYKFMSDDSKPLKLEFNGKSLQEYEISEHTNYVSQNILSSDPNWGDFQGAEGFLVKHLVPAGTKAYVGSNPYSGNISVIAEFTFTAVTGEVSPPVDVPLYTTTTKRTAEDDLVNDKVR